MALVLQAALVAVVALLLRELLGRFLASSLATATALVWSVLANHGSLLHWAAAAPITVALALLLAGLLLLDDDRPVRAALVLGAGVLCYEAVAPAALVGLVAVPALRRRPWRRSLLAGLVVLSPVGVWMIANLPSVKASRSPDLALVLPAHLGWGVFPDGPVATVGGALACVAVVLVTVDVARRREPDAASAMVGAGLATIVLGTLPFVRYYYAPLGAGDRVNVVAGIGTALLWTGLGAWLWPRLPRAAAVPMIAAVGAGMAAASWQGATAWADAADDSTRILAELPPLSPGDVGVVERPPVRRNVTAFADPSNIRGAVQLEAGSRDVDARFRPGR